MDSEYYKKELFAILEDLNSGDISKSWAVSCIQELSRDVISRVECDEVTKSKDKGVKLGYIMGKTDAVLVIGY